MKVCSVLDCSNNEDTHRITKGMCSKHYSRWIRYKDASVNFQPHRPCGMSLSSVVLYEVSRSIQRRNGCLETKTTIRKKDGYGQITFGGKSCLIHRLVLEQYIGRLLGQGEQANHLCHNTKCINPFHLYAGTQKDNIEDMVKAERNVVSVNHYRGGAVLSSEDVICIRERFQAGCGYNKLASDYGVLRRCIKDVVHYKSWKEVS